MTECDKIVILWILYQQKKTNTIATNVMSTASINYYSKKARDCYIFHSFISNHITIDDDYYLLL